MTKQNTVSETASLHEKSVQAVAKGEVPKKPRKARRTAQKKSETVTQIKVDPKVWAAAQRIRNNRANRYTTIVIISSTEVVVR